MPRTQPESGDELRDTARRLHRSAIHLLRALRIHDTAAGLPAPQLSALSVLVFAGPRTVGELAEAEQVKPPSISRTVKALEAAGLVRRRADPEDGRVQRLFPTAKGRRVLEAGRDRRVDALAAALATLSARDRTALARATGSLERLVRAT